MKDHDWHFLVGDGVVLRRLPRREAVDHVEDVVVDEQVSDLVEDLRPVVSDHSVQHFLLLRLIRWIQQERGVLGFEGVVVVLPDAQVDDEGREEADVNHDLLIVGEHIGSLVDKRAHLEDCHDDGDVDEDEAWPDKTCDGFSNTHVDEGVGGAQQEHHEDQFDNAEDGFLVLLATPKAFLFVFKLCHFGS